MQKVALESQSLTLGWCFHSDLFPRSSHLQKGRQRPPLSPSKAAAERELELLRSPAAVVSVARPAGLRVGSHLGRSVGPIASDVLSLIPDLLRSGGIGHGDWVPCCAPAPATPQKASMVLHGM